MATNILITGASSGIGAALAELYAGSDITLFLSGRNTERLDGIAQICRKRGADARACVLDVTDRNAMKEWIETCDAEHPLDLIIANAGISSGMQQHHVDSCDKEALSCQIHAINVEGVQNTVEPAIPLMKVRGQGQVAIMSSLAGLRPLPSAPAYSASKVAVRHYGEALRHELQPFGIKINVILPGFVESRITAQNTFKMPLLMTASSAAEIIRKGLSRDKARIAFPFPMYAMMWAIAALPIAVGDIVLSSLPRKQ